MSVITFEQMARLDKAFEKNGWTTEIIEKLCESDRLCSQLKLLQDESVLVRRAYMLEHIHTITFPWVDAYDFAVSIPCVGTFVPDVYIAQVDSAFDSLDGGINEPFRSEITMHYSDVNHDFKDAELIAEIGGTNSACISKADLYNLLKQQGHGESGVLNIDGYRNIFYMRCEHGSFYTVTCYWSKEKKGWVINFHRLIDFYDNDDRWRSGLRVFFRAEE